MFTGRLQQHAKLAFSTGAIDPVSAKAFVWMMRTEIKIVN
jgi:hypothetical protein